VSNTAERPVRDIVKGARHERHKYDSLLVFVKPYTSLHKSHNKADLPALVRSYFNIFQKPLHLTKVSRTFATSQARPPWPKALTYAGREVLGEVSRNGALGKKCLPCQIIHANNAVHPPSMR
jgi:hypothetical protein